MRTPSTKCHPLFLRALLVLAVLPILYLHLTALRAADDFYYSTFWMNGPAAFWELTLHHYDAFNGRALVHFVAQTVLAFPPIVFALVNTLLLYGMGVLCAKLGTNKLSRMTVQFTIFFFLIQILLLSTPVMTQGLLWASASYNYMLPIFIILLGLFLLDKFLANAWQGVGWLLAFLLVQFLAGATTEQCGFIAATVMGMYGLCWAVRTRKCWWKLFFAPLLNALGYLTIFLSPATQRRATNGVKVEWAALQAQFWDMTESLFSWDGILLQFLVTGVLLTLCLLIPKARRGLNRTVLSLLIGALSGALIMVPTANFDPRTLLPIALLLMLVSARCAALLLEQIPQSSLAPILCGTVALGVCFGTCFPMFIGATRNYILELQNRVAIQEGRKTGEVYYCIDYDERWCYPQLMYNDGTYYLKFIKANGLEHCNVIMTSKHYKNIFLAGQQRFFPVYEREGTVFFPLRNIIEGFGGTVNYNQEQMTILLNGNEVTISSAQIANWKAGNAYSQYDLNGKYSICFFTVYYTADVYKVLFGINIRLDGDQYICSTEAPH